MAKKQETRGRKPGKFYVSNDELVKEIRQYYDTGEFTEQLGRYIQKTVDGVSHSPNYINYFKEDNPWGVEMYSDAIWRITKAIHDKGCKIVDEELIGEFETDLDGNIIYEIDSETEKYILDDDGKKIPKVITQNNIFGYFSMIAWNAFRGRIKKEKKDQKDIEDYKNKVFEEYELEYGIEHQEEGEYKGDGDW
jgi:hypothetical protein